MVIAPERANKPVKSNRAENSVTKNERVINMTATRLVIKLLLIFKIYPLFKNEIILKWYHYVNNMKREYMKKETYELFQNSSVDTIVEVIEKMLEQRNESPIWTTRVAPFSKAILSVLVALKENNLLFNPEGKPVNDLTPELFFEWADFVSLKTLAFTIQKSNEAGVLLRTSYSSEDTAKYKKIELSTLGDYLSANNVNLEKELLDFPISSYNLHQGVSNVIKSLL